MAVFFLQFVWIFLFWVSVIKIFISIFYMIKDANERNSLAFLVSFFCRNSLLVLYDLLTIFYVFCCRFYDYFQSLL
jgi:hypothetical protein